MVCICHCVDAPLKFCQTDSYKIILPLYTVEFNSWLLEKAKFTNQMTTFAK